MLSNGYLLRSSRSHGLRSLYSVFSSDLVIDLGTANTLVYGAGKGSSATSRATSYKGLGLNPVLTDSFTFLKIERNHLRIGSSQKRNTQIEKATRMMGLR